MLPFQFAATPHIHFGIGSRHRLPEILAPFGRRLLLVTGGRSFENSEHGQQLLAALAEQFEIRQVRVAGEPSPTLVDAAVADHRPFAPQMVLAIGGGSAIDAGKAIAGLIASGDSVLDYLEGVGRGKAYAGPSTPFIAIPTTAGTGGETSKNAVLSEIGPKGYKKSFRHEQLVARAIVVDPELTLSCPPEVTAACGMDALTQLIESYLSTGANPMTDALAFSAIELMHAALPRAVVDGGDLDARSRLCYAASISGLTLANAGLGSVHGISSPLGAMFPIGHGIACGTLLAATTAMNLTALTARLPQSPALAKYAQLGRLLTGEPQAGEEDAHALLLRHLHTLTESLAMPRLGRFGIGEADIAAIVAGSRGNSMKSNPVVLRDDEIADILRIRL